uniref:Uncharacterized protein n=1 Tax=Leersia perrieri TaxID=77586 RepID=A0A0D9XYU0_9ORYZ
MDRARRRPGRVPAFGEWNYYYGGADELSSAAGAAAAGACYNEQVEACSDVWFRYSPPPRNPAPRKASRRRRTAAVDQEKKPVGGGDKRRLPQARTSSSSDSVNVTAAHTPAKQQKAVARRPPAVDADLYQVPPPDFLPGEPIPRKKSGRSMWMGCLGLSC